MADNKVSFLWSVGQQESDGDYTRVNSSSGALGKYQVMPSNLSAWTKSALGHTLTSQQYLANPAAQDAVANKILGGYYDRYGAKGAAAMWYSGQSDPTKTYGNPPVYQYVKDVVDRMTKGSPTSGSTPVSSTATPAISLDDILPGLGDGLAKGLEDGLLSAFKAMMTPILKWSFWFFEVAIGAGAVIGGVFLMAQKSDLVKTVEKTVLSSSPEGRTLAGSIPTKPKVVKGRTE